MRDTEKAKTKSGEGDHFAVADEEKFLDLPIWTYLVFFLCCLALFLADKWYGPVSGLIYSKLF